MGSARVVKVYRPPRGTQAFLSIPRFFPGALKSESSREIFHGLGRRRGKKLDIQNTIQNITHSSEPGGLASGFQNFVFFLVFPLSRGARRFFQRAPGIRPWFSEGSRF